MNMDTREVAGTLRNLIADGNEDSDILKQLAEKLDPIHPRGTILHADSIFSDRFKPGSMWVSNGDGTYLHLTGESGLTAKHSRLSGHTYIRFSV